MIFVGDVAIASGDRFTHSGIPMEMLSDQWCVNLEGAVSASRQAIDWGVYNSTDWTDSFGGLSVELVFLGNNHVTDLKNGIAGTIDALAPKGMTSFGAGSDAGSAARHLVVNSGSHSYVLLGFGWSVVGCRPARTEAGVNPLEGGHVLRSVRAAKLEHPNARIVVVAHWNYEFEPYPQPAHRSLAHAMIDSGVYAVIGHHPHIVGPVERYKGRTIAYSLGNWAFSYGRHFGGRLQFPESSFEQIALQLGDDDRVHHARFSPPTHIEYQSSEFVREKSFSLRPVFEGLTHAEYIEWFRKNRVKRKGLPVYVDPHDSMSNRLRDGWVSLRQVGIDTAAKLGLKSMRR